MSRFEDLFSPRGSRGPKGEEPTSELLQVKEIRKISASRYETYLKEYRSLQAESDDLETLREVERCFLRLIINPKLPLGRSSLSISQIRKIHRRQRRGYCLFCRADIKSKVRIEKEDPLLEEITQIINDYWKK